MKPSVLYHASSDRSIKVFEPRAESMRDPLEGPRVFATPSKAMAAIFIVGTDDSWVQSGAFDDIPYIVIGDEARFRQIDTGGAVYSLPSETFECVLNKGLGPLEWTSTQPVVPIGKEEYASGLEAMIQNGVRVYFVDMGTLRNIQSAPDHGREILKSLTKTV